HVVPPADLAALIDRLVREPAPGPPDLTRRPEAPDTREPSLAGTAALRGENPPGRPSGLVCPECGGVLWQSEHGNLLHFRCHVGHAYGGESLLAAQSDALEGALWG